MLRSNLIIKIKMVLNCQALSNKAIYVLLCRSSKIFLLLRKGLCIRLCSSSLKRKKWAESTSRKILKRGPLCFVLTRAKKQANNEQIRQELMVFISVYNPRLSSAKTCHILSGTNLITTLENG